MQSTKYPELNDREWLKHQYDDLGLSTVRIAKRLGCGSSSVRQAMLDHGIKIRDASARRALLMSTRVGDGFIFNRSVIDGCLLGDASLITRNKHSDTSIPYFQKMNKPMDHVEFVASLLFEEWGDKIHKLEHHSGGVVTKTQYAIYSLSYDEFLPMHREWYPASRGYKKSVPESLQIDETVLLHWFLDDGMCGLHRGTRPRLIFCSESFLLEDQKMLCQKVNDVFPLGMKVYAAGSGTGWRIGIPPDNVALFYEIIGPPPVPSLAHKWKETRESLRKRIIDTDGLYQLYMMENHTVPEIAQQLGVSAGTVYKTISRLKKTEWKDRLVHWTVDHPELADPEWLYQRYVVERVPQAKIAEMVGATNVAIVTYYVSKFREREWAGKKVVPLRVKFPQLDDPEWLYQRHIVGGATLTEIAEEVGASGPSTVLYRVRRYKETVWLGRPGV